MELQGVGVVCWEMRVLFQALLLQLLCGEQVLPWNTTCPVTCHCELTQEYGNRNSTQAPKQTADCSKKKLRYVPQDLPINTEILLLHGNAIRTLHENLPQLSLLEQLDLSGNQITSLGPYPMFQNYTFLLYLSMAHNALETLFHGSFSGLSSLEHLDLSHNQIDLIEDSAFGGLNRLQKLSLRDNKITQLSDKWFESLLSLESLSLEGNQLRSIDSPVFKGLFSLKVLSLSSNRLSKLSQHALIGLENLSELDLDDNFFVQVPSATLIGLQALKLLTLNKNPIRLLSKLDFQSFAVEEIQLCRMTELLAVNAGAFYDISNLHILNLHDNPKLSYLDPGAFVHTNTLSVLDVQNNKLKALPYTLPLVLPELTEVFFSGNPIHCDCNLHWMKELTDLSSNSSIAADNSTAITFPNIDKLKCHTPVELQGKAYTSLQLSKLPSNCSPTVIAFFNDSEYLALGEGITFECRGIGVPAPHIHWILPSGKILNGTSNQSRLRMDTMGTLTIDHLKAGDAGKYTCVATNNLDPKDFDIAHSALHIHNKYIRLIIAGIATNFITVTWNGTGGTVATSNYLLLYRQLGLENNYHKVNIRPYMRTYTITNLKPHTLYEFCIAFAHDVLNFQKLNCVNIQTKHQMFMMTGIRSMGNLSILIAIVIAIGLICFLCAATVVIRRYRKRKAYKQTDGNNVPPKVGNLSQIPLDNIYQPPSTPLCTSRTSLITTPTSSA